jgi:DNA-binding MarR family transcriptional regulator
MEADVSPIDALVQLSFAMHARIEAGAAREGLSVTQMRLLGILRDREPTVGELAAHLGLSKSSVSGLIDRAAQRDLVSRIQDGRDGRSVRVRIEPAGRMLIDTAAAGFEEELRDVVQAITAEERREWVRLTMRLLTAEAADDGRELLPPGEDSR